MKPIDVLFLSKNDVVALDLSPAQVVAVVEKAFLEHSDDTKGLVRRRRPLLGYGREV